MRKILAFIVIAGFLGYVGWRYYTDKAVTRQSRRAAASVVAVETARITKADLGDRVVFTGSIKAEERFDAAPKIPGIVREINFNVGDTVKRGDLLATLDDDEYELAVEQARASLLVAQANANDADKQYEIALRDYERSRNLHAGNVISTQDFDKADAAYRGAEAKRETATAQVKLAEASLRTAEVRLGYTRIVADWIGGSDKRVIGQRYIDAGARIPINAAILSVLDINTVRAVISVSEKEYPKMAIGDPVAVTTDAFPGRTFAGKVARISQELGAYTREAEVEIAIANTDLALKPGMFIRADIEFARRNDATAAPIEAIVRRDDGKRGVYVVNEARDKVAFKPITEGIVDGRMVELVDAGELLGSEVVVLGQHLLKDGIAVRVAGAAERAERPERNGAAAPANGGPS